MGPVGKGIQDAFVSGETSGVFQRAASDAVGQPGWQGCFMRWPAGYQLYAVCSQLSPKSYS